MTKTQATAVVWVRGLNDLNWRVNASFTRASASLAYERACAEASWYQKQGYRFFIGDEAPELPVPLRAGEVG